MRVTGVIIRIIRQFFRDKRSLAMMFGAPMLLLWLLSLVFTQKDYIPQIAVVDMPAQIVKVMKNQEASFKKLNVDYQRLEFEWEGRIIENKPNISIDKILLENSSDQVLVRNIATVKIAQDVTPELILNYLRIQNCAQVLCNEEQKSVIAAISQNVAQIGEADGEELPGKNIGIQDLLFAKVINADSYIL